MWSGVMFLLSNHLALRNEPEPELNTELNKEITIPLLSEQKIQTKVQVTESVHGTRTKNSVNSVDTVNVKKISDSLDERTQHVGSYDTDTTSESGSGQNSTDSLNQYYMPGEEGERDYTTQDIDGKTLTITPSFTMLSTLNDVIVRNQMNGIITNNNNNENENRNINENRKKSINEDDDKLPYIQIDRRNSNNMDNKNQYQNQQSENFIENTDDTTCEDDWSDFIVLDNSDDAQYDLTDVREIERRKINDEFLHPRNLNELNDEIDNENENENENENDVNNEIEERNLDENGLRRRIPIKLIIDKKLKKSPTKLKREKENKKIIENISDEIGNGIKTILSHRDLLSAILRVNSTAKMSSKKYSDTWMSKINGTDNGRPLMFRVGSTCMTMSNLVNENRERERSPKTDREK